MEVKLLRDHSATARKKARFHVEDTLDENVNEMNEADDSPEEAHFRKHILYVILYVMLLEGLHLISVDLNYSEKQQNWRRSIPKSTAVKTLCRK